MILDLIPRLMPSHRNPTANFACIQKNCRLLFRLATSRTGCLAAAQQNSDRNVSYKDNSYKMYVMRIKIHFSPRKEYQTVHGE